MIIGRRGILGALVGLVAAPAIIKVADLMPVKPSLAPGLMTLDDFASRILEPQVNRLADQVALDVMGGPSLEVGDMITIELDPIPGLDQRPREFVVTDVGGDRSYRVTRDPVLSGPGRGNTYLTIDMITREAVKLWEQENLFLKYVSRDTLARGDVVRDLLAQPVPPVAAAALGAAAVLHKNPTLSRRGLFFGGVREEGSVASPDPSSSDPTRRNPTNQETVA